jgi:hypothetical protein
VRTARFGSCGELQGLSCPGVSARIEIPSGPLCSGGSRCMAMALQRARPCRSSACRDDEIYHLIAVGSLNRAQVRKNLVQQNFNRSDLSRELSQQQKPSSLSFLGWCLLLAIIANVSGGTLLYLAQRTFNSAWSKIPCPGPQEPEHGCPHPFLSVFGSRSVALGRI